MPKRQLFTCSARRSGENQKPLYTSSAYRGMMSSCNTDRVNGR